MGKYDRPNPIEQTTKTDKYLLQSYYSCTTQPTEL